MDLHDLKLEFNNSTILMKVYKVTEIEQQTFEPPLDQGRNKEKKDFLEFKENEGTMYLNLWDSMKVLLGEKFIVLSVHIKKVEKAHISNLTAHLKALE